MKRSYQLSKNQSELQPEGFTGGDDQWPENGGTRWWISAMAGFGENEVGLKKTDRNQLVGADRDPIGWSVRLSGRV